MIPNQNVTSSPVAQQGDSREVTTAAGPLMGASAHWSADGPKMGIASGLTGKRS